MAGAKGADSAELFSRSVSLALKARLRNLKKQVLEELGMEKMCTLRVYYYESFEASQVQDDDKSLEKDDPESVA
jgi:hypothetical protein